MSVINSIIYQLRLWTVSDIAILDIIVVLLEELAKVRPWTYCKISIWLEKVEHYKTLRFIFTYKNG